MDTRTTAAELRARLSAIADALYRLESDPELSLLRDPSLLRGRSASVAAEVATRTARLWDRYPATKEQLDRLGDRDHHHEAADNVAVMEADVAVVEREARALTRAWADALPQLDDLVARTAKLAALADELGAGDEPEIAMAEASVDTLAGDVAADPLDVDTTAARQAVERAEALVGTLVAQRDGLAQALATAEALVDELAQAIAAGADALERARSRVAEADGLLQPLDPAVLDTGPQGLRPWVARIREEADAGNWRTAATALARWQAVADGWRANADRVLEANSAPVRRRDELRGLLDAYQAKAGRAGLAEDVELGRRHDAAHQALHTAPCRLDEADALVRAYIDAVNGAQ